MLELKDCNCLMEGVPNNLMISKDQSKSELDSKIFRFKHISTIMHPFILLLFLYLSTTYPLHYHNSNLHKSLQDLTSYVHSLFFISSPLILNNSLNLQSPLYSFSCLKIYSYNLLIHELFIRFPNSLNISKAKILSLISIFYSTFIFFVFHLT